MATLIADWACYTTPVDRVDYARLNYIMSSAYRYFRVWCCNDMNGQLLPVGYSAWYPISPFVFDSLQKDPSQIDDRGVFMPLRFANPEKITHAYAFNISIIDALKNTPCSLKMIHAYKKDSKKAGQHIAAITVSAEGSQFSSIGGLKASGVVTIQGESETLYLKSA